MEENYSVSLSKIIDEFKLETIYLPELPDDIMISCSRVNRPGLQMVGFYDHYEQARLQIIGKVEHLFLEQLYFHYGRYLAISSNRKNIAAPNNLQGIWNDRGTDSPWNSDIHTNINIQMISTSEIRISVLIDQEDAAAAVRAVHDKFFGDAD